MSGAPAPIATLQVDDVAAATFHALSCDIMAGQVARFTCAVQAQREELWALLTGLQRPRHGRISWAGQDLYALPGRERLRLFQRVGAVPHDGGLISNLRAWENIVLPVWYHRGIDVSRAEAEIVRIFRELGLENESIRRLMRCLPDPLSAGERRWVAIARAMLMEPDIMVYDAPFTGVERDAAARLLRLIVQFHRARTERVSVFLLPDESFSERVPADITIALET